LQAAFAPSGGMIVAITLSLLAVGLLLAVLRMVVLPAGEKRMRLRVPFILLLALGSAGIPLVSIAFQATLASAGSALRQAMSKSALGGPSPTEFGDDRAEAQTAEAGLFGALADSPFAAEIDTALRDWLGFTLPDDLTPPDSLGFRFLDRPIRPAAQLFAVPLEDIVAVAALADSTPGSHRPSDLIGGLPVLASNGGAGGAGAGSGGGGDLGGGILPPPLSGSPPPIDPDLGGGTPSGGGTAVPEPGTWLVMGIGFAMLGLILRARRAVAEPEGERQRG